MYHIFLQRFFLSIIKAKKILRKKLKKDLWTRTRKNQEAIERGFQMDWFPKMDKKTLFFQTRLLYQEVQDQGAKGTVSAQNQPLAMIAPLQVE